MTERKRNMAGTESRGEREREREREREHDTLHGMLVEQREKHSVAFFQE